jgi:hypothetical protein
MKRCSMAFAPRSQRDLQYSSRLVQTTPSSTRAVCRSNSTRCTRRRTTETRSFARPVLMLNQTMSISTWQSLGTSSRRVGPVAIRSRAGALITLQFVDKVGRLLDDQFGFITGSEKATGLSAGRLGHLHHSPRLPLIGAAGLSRSATGHAARAACFFMLALAFFHAFSVLVIFAGLLGHGVDQVRVTYGFSIS